MIKSPNRVTFLGAIKGSLSAIGLPTRLAYFDLEGEGFPDNGVTEFDLSFLVEVSQGDGDGYGGIYLSGWPDLEAIDFSGLEKVKKLELFGPNQIAEISLPALAEVTTGGHIRIQNFSLLETVNLPSLVTLADPGTFNLRVTNAALAVDTVNSLLQLADSLGMTAGVVDLSGGTSHWPTGAGITAMDALILAGVSVTVNANPYNYVITDATLADLEIAATDYESVSAPNLTDITAGSAEFSYDDDLVSVSLPVLDTVSTSVYIDNCPSLATLDLSSLTTVSGGYFWVAVTALTIVSAPLLASLPFGNISIQNNSQLTTLSLPSVNNATALNVTNNSSLVDVDLGSWKPPAAALTVTASNNALSAASVNHILARCVAQAAFAGTVLLNGGTSASPTGQGLLDKATLEGRGGTVLTN